MSFVTYADFETRYELAIPIVDRDRIEAFLTDACAIVGDAVGVTYVSSDYVPAQDEVVVVVPAAVVGVVCTAVRRAYENPMGLSMEATGSHTWQTMSRGSGVYFTGSEMNTIRRAAGILGTSVTMTTDTPAVWPAGVGGPGRL